MVVCCKRSENTHTHVPQGCSIVGGLGTGSGWDWIFPWIGPLLGFGDLDRALDRTDFGIGNSDRAGMRSGDFHHKGI